MRSWKKRLLMLVLAASALLLLAACAPAAPAPTPTKAPAAAPTAPPPAATATPAAAKPKELLKLKVATPHLGTPETGSVIGVAEALGFFKEEGVEVELVFTKGGGDTVQAVQVPGGADVGLETGPMSILGAVEKGADLKIISAAITPPIFYWIAAKDSPYKTAKDLAGKPVGYTSAGSSSHMFLLGVLDKEGVKAEPVAAGTLGGMWTQVKTGQLAAAVSVAPEVWQRVDQEGARIVIATTDYPEFAQYTYVVNFARGDSLKNKPEAIKAFHRGWKRAADYMVKDPAAATKAYMPNTEIAENLVLRYFKEVTPTKYRLAPIGGMDISVKYAKLFKFITKDPDLSKVVDLSLTPQ